MYKALRALCICASLLVLVACAGKDFARPSPDDFKLGQTTYAQLMQQMGEPRKTSDILKNGKNVKAVTYAYASKSGEPLEADVIPARAASYFFYNDVLVGQEFVSSFKSDNSNFDDKRVESIKKGQTTRAEVIKLMGQPTGTFMPPMVKETSGEAFGYAYQAIRGGLFSGLKSSAKILRVSFDDKGVVSDVEYTSSENK